MESHFCNTVFSYFSYLREVNVLSFVYLYFGVS